MRRYAVAGDAEHDGIGAAELEVVGAEVEAFLRAAGRRVLGVEIKDDVLSAQTLEVDGLVTRGRQFEIGHDTAHLNLTH